MSTVSTQPDAGPMLRRRGAIILAVFACIWAAGGISRLGALSEMLPALIGVVAVTVIIIVYALRSDQSASPSAPTRLPPDWNRRLGLVNLLQAAGIVVSVVLLSSAGAPSLIPATVCVIVGMHFIPLARIFDEAAYTLAGLVLCAIGLVGYGMVALVDGPTSQVVVGCGAALTLWSTAVYLRRPCGAS
ncbi:MAG: hypothetical protein AB7K36_21350 [Chloroflexota bacterium]